MITAVSRVFFLKHTSTQIPLSAAHGYSFPLPHSFSGFPSQSNPHCEDLFLIFRNTRFHNRFYIWTVTSLKSTTR